MGRLLSAMILLAGQLLLHLLALPFRRRRGLQELHERFLPDRLLPLDATDRDLAVLLARCDGCGLCDSACALRQGHAGVPLTPSRLVLNLSRSTPSLVLAQEDLEPFLGCGACNACASWCPQRIPVGYVPGWAAGQLDRLLAAPPSRRARR